MTQKESLIRARFVLVSFKCFPTARFFSMFCVETAQPAINFAM